MNVLIADKSTVTRKILSNSVEHYFYSSKGKRVRLFEAENGDKALDTMTRNDIDIVMLDSMISDTKKGEIIDIVRSNPRWNKTRIIVSTQDTSKEKVVSLIKKGVNGYIVKPFEEKTIYKTLNSVTARMIRA